jgi:hypothetical protein
MYLTPNIGESDKLVHFRGKFLPVSLARKVLFCTFKFLLIFEALPYRKILFLYIKKSELNIKSPPIAVCGTKKRLNFVDLIMRK